MKIAILGAGAWGSALAVSLCAAHEVSLWARSADARAALRATRRSAYLPEADLPPAIAIADDLAATLRAAHLVIVATSTAGLRETAMRVTETGLSEPHLLWACKGFEAASGRLPHEVVAEVLPGASRVGALSGPSFAIEVARGQPTALVLASVDDDFARQAAAALNGARLRIYSSSDVLGVELGGAVKNVIAIAAGICDGLELGNNARAALITRGLAEIVRLGVAVGGKRETFTGLAGLGDLVLTCTGALSRNHQVGVCLARGMPVNAILEQLGHVAEGVQSASQIRERARRHAVDMPIVDAVCGVLYGTEGAAAAVQRLLAREPKAE